MGHRYSLQPRLPVCFVAGAMMAVLTGCGYQFVGESSLLPADAQTIYVEPFVNRSRQVGIDKELASSLRAEFYRRGRLKVVDASEQADIILSGVIRSLESTVASVNRKDEVLQYESALTLDVTLRRRQPNEILWRGQGIRLTQVYAGSRAAVVTTSSEFRTGTLNSSDVRRLTDIQLTESQRLMVQNDLMDRFAEEVHQRVMEMF
jgi:outer membrane lipopolysaccharide assembly protein LptE/RlpB